MKISRRSCSETIGRVANSKRLTQIMLETFSVHDSVLSVSVNTTPRMPRKYSAKYVQKWLQVKVMMNYCSMTTVRIGYEVKGHKCGKLQVGNTARYGRQ